MAIHNSIAGAPVVNNNGVGFGVRYSSEVLSSVDLGLSSTKTGSIVVDGQDTDEALSAGTFAYNNNSPIAKRVTRTLSGVDNDFLLKGAARPDLIQSVHKIESIRTRRIATAIRSGFWNEYTGSWTTNPTVAVDSFVGSDSTSNDYAARVSRNQPGNLTYKLGNPSVVTVGYAKKTN